MVAIPKRHDVELTGRARARPGWFGRLVLQVEIRITSYSACPPPPGRDPNEWRDQKRAEGAARTEWRDATWDDLHARERKFALLRPGMIEPSKPWPRVGQVPPRQSPPASPPYTSWAAILEERERCAQLAESMDCAWRCRVGQEVGAAIRRQGCGPGQPDPDLRR